MEFIFDLENPLAGADEQNHQLCKMLFVSSAYSEDPLMIFAAESEQMSSLGIALNQVSARCHAISFIVQVQFSSSLDPELVYLAVNYIDRFLSKREIPRERTWIIRLLAISCISLASKMKEAEFPHADFQMDIGFIFDSRTIQRMEVLVLDTLGWRMRSITPFSFLRFFLSFFPLDNPNLIKSLKAYGTQILFKYQNDIKSLEFRPSVIAAAALLAAASQISPAHLVSFHSAMLCCVYLNKEALAECCATMDSHDSSPGIEAASNGCGSEYSSLTPVTVLGPHHRACLESDKTVGSTSDGSDANKNRFSTSAPYFDHY